MAFSSQHGAGGGAAESSSAQPPSPRALPEAEAEGLLEAAWRGDLVGVKAALAAGQRVCARQAETGMTALHLASAAAITPAFRDEPARDSGQTDVIRFLLSVEGVDANLADERGNLPLHLAARLGLPARVELLLPHSSVAACDKDGKTPLAALEALIASGGETPEHARIVELLKRAMKGAWVDVPNGSENSTVRLPSGTRVRYGADSRWVERTVGGLFPIHVTNKTFGDPAVGAAKKLQKWVPA
jgi:hypothetical protein